MHRQPQQRGKGITLSRRTLWAAAAISAVATVVAVLVLMNLNSSDDYVTPWVEHLYPAEDAQFERALAAVGPALVGGNRIDTLLNGKEIFPAMLSAITEARHSINFENFVYEDGDLGKRFAEALGGAARRGVEVRVLLDAIGSQKMADADAQIMRDAGVQLRMYHPLNWYHIERANNRSHRRFLIVDGVMAFTGGAGIADYWLGDADSPEHWRDTQYRITGPVVGQIQAVFVKNWSKVTGEVLHSGLHFPAIPTQGSSHAQAVVGAPGSGANDLQQLYLLAMGAAQRSIRISPSYFVVDELSERSLLAARKRGVIVEIIVPGDEIDSPLVNYASRARWGHLLRAGVRIYEYQPTMYHCKLLVIDGLFVSIGSANFDPRSFYLNDEANVNIVDMEFAEEQERIFAADLAHTREITFDEWKNRPFWEKAREHLVSLMGSQL